MALRLTWHWLSGFLWFRLACANPTDSARLLQEVTNTTTTTSTSTTLTATTSTLTNTTSTTSSTSSTSTTSSSTSSTSLTSSLTSSSTTSTSETFTSITTSTLTSTSLPPVLPARLILTIEFLGVADQYCDSQNCSEVQIPAGLEIRALRLQSPDDSYDWGSDPRLLLAHRFAGFDEQAARRGQCVHENARVQVGTYLRVEPEEWGDGVQAVTDTGDLLSDAGFLPLTFREGGEFALCFTENNDFSGGHVDLVPITFAVLGAYDSSCSNTAASPCLPARVQYCYLLQGAYSPACVVSFDWDSQQGVLGNVSEIKISWTSPWDITFSDGSVASVQRPGCETVGSENFLCADGDRCDAGDFFLDLDANASASLRSRGDLTGSTFKGYTVSVCMCALGDCLQPELFLQEVGVLHFFAAGLCLPGSCGETVGAIAAIYPMLLQVFCPGDACQVSDLRGSRLKLIDPGVDTSRSWDRNNGCRTAWQSPLQTSPPNCVNPASCALSGGERQDVKVFGAGAEGPFQFLQDRPEGATYEVKRLELCFCLEDCESDARLPSFFKVGQLSLLPLRPMASALPWQVPGRQGRLGIDLGEGPEESFQPAAMEVPPAGVRNAEVKLLSDNSLSLGDMDCLTSLAAYRNASSPHFLLLSLGNSTEFEESEVLLALTGQLEQDSSKITFNNSISLSLNRPGRVAVCYCGSEASQCPSDLWRIISHFTVRGPSLANDLTPSQGWTVSVGVHFGLQLTGWGLLATDRILIPQGGCQALEDSIHVGCPGACQPQSERSEGISLQVLDFATVPCGGVAEDTGQCPQVLVEAVHVSHLGAEITFGSVPTGLAPGDVLSLGEQVACANESSEMGWCSVEDEDELRGIYAAPGADPQNSSVLGDSHYLVGRTLQSTPDPRTFRLDAVWPSSRMPSFQIQGEGLQWVVHNKGHTATELLATEPAELPVCWQPLHGAPLLAGSLSVVQAASLQCSVYLTALGRNEIAPALMSFKAGGLEGQQGGTQQLRLEFPSGLLFGIRAASDASDGDLEEVAGQRSPEGAEQALCGRLFKEMWSDDPDGFPMPQGCYLQRPTNASWAVGLVFSSAKLKAHTSYQLVLRGKVGEAELGQEVARAMVMGDILLQPFHVLEMGPGILQSVPQVPASMSGEPDLRSCTVLGGTNGILELGPGVPLQLSLEAGSSLRAVRRGNLLRLYLWPLLGWELDAGPCQAMCSMQGGCGFVDCETFAIEDGANRSNAVKMTLPNDLDAIYGSVQNVFEVSLTPPPGGFFPGRLGVQVTTETDAFPSYCITSGSFIYRSVTAVAGLLDTAGNERPFQQQTGNILYAKFRLGATLHSEYSGFAASLEISPPGYSCIAAGAADLASGEAGSLEDAGWSNQGQSCLYSLPEGMAIFAGSSIMVRLQVNNPSLPRQREDVMNTWFLGLRSSGSSMSFRSLNLSAFDLATELGANYSSSRSILGVITDATIQPLMQQPTLPFLQPAEQSFTAVQIFFRPSQDVLAGGAVLVQAAPGFSFGTCQSSDLPASSHYYFDYSSGTQSTSPLPQLSCETSSNSPFHALIRLKSRIFASQMYAWQITVRMPPVDLYDENYGWYLYTQTAAGSLVDGTTTAVPAANRDVFKLYHRSLPLQAAFSSLQPFELSGTESTLQLLFRLGIPVTGALRLTMPEGFSFNFPSSSFISLAGNRSDGGDVVPGATSDWPAGVPAQSSSILTWSTSSYMPLEVYGFLAPLILSRNPTESTNSILLEFGYDDDWSPAQWEILRTTGCQSTCADGQSYSRSLEDANALQILRTTCRQACLLDFSCAEIEIRFAASAASCSLCPYQSCTRVERSDAEIHPLRSLPRPFAALQAAPLLRALMGAKVSFRTRRAGATSVARFQLRIVTAVPARGALIIEAPEGFDFSEQCHPQDVLLNLSDAILRSMGDGTVGCSFFRLLGVPRLQLQGDLEPGLYSFELPVQNPVSLDASAIDSTCGAAQCWLFSTVEDASAGVPRELDRRIAAASPQLLQTMSLAGLQDVNAPQRILTGRNDQPQAVNNLILFFMLSNDLEQSTATLQLTAPDFFLFAEDCREGFVIDENSVFGVGQPFPSGFQPLPPVSIGCYGNMEMAMASLTPATLSADVKYAFRVQVQNPPSPPTVNTWSLTIADEASELFDSFLLWQIQDGRFMPSSIAANSTDSEVGSCSVVSSMRSPPLKLRFRVGSGFQQLRVEAPAGWRLLDTFCAFGLEGAVIRSGGNTTCALDADNMLRVRLVSSADAWPGGAAYELWIAAEVSADASGSWQLQTYRLDVPSGAEIIKELIYDVGHVSGPRVHPQTGWNVIRRSEPFGDVLVNTTLVMVPGSLMAGDAVAITAPSGFNLADSFGNCWHVDVFTDSIPADVSCDRQQARLLQAAARDATCFARTLNLYINSSWSALMDGMLLLDVQAFSSSLPPAEEDNFWSVAIGRNGSLAEGGHAMSWIIVPRVKEPRLELLSTFRRAGAFPVQLRVSFGARVAADRWELEARQPDDFDFSQVLASMETAGDLAGTFLELREVPVDPNKTWICSRAAAMVADMRYTITLDEVRLPDAAGAVGFQVHTYIADRLSNSGPVTPSFSVVSNIEASNFRVLRQDDGLHPVAQVLLGPRPARLGRLTSVHISLQLDASAGQLFRLAVESVLLQEMMLSHSQNPCSRTSATQDAGELVVEVLCNITASLESELEVQAVFPALPEGAFPAWTLEVQEMLPNLTRVTVSSNDGQFAPALPLASTFTFLVSPVSVAPNSEVVLQVSLDPGGAEVTHVELVAPVGVTFPANCLASSSRSILSCLAQPQEGRKNVTLTLTSAATVERSRMDDIFIRVHNPASTDPDEWNRWLAIGRVGQDGAEVGWGYTDEDYGITPMVAALEYAPVQGNVTLKLSVQVSARALADLNAAGSRSFLELSYRGSASSAEAALLRCDLGDPDQEKGWRQEEDLWFRQAGWHALELPAGLTLELQPCNASGAPRAVFEMAGVQEGLLSLAVEATLVAPLIPSLVPVARWDVTLLDSSDHIVDMYPGLEAPAWWSRQWSLQPLLLSWEGRAALGAQVAVTLVLKSQAGDAPTTICLRPPSTFAEGAPAAGFKLFLGPSATLADRLKLVPIGWPWIKKADVFTNRICFDTESGNISSSSPGTRYSFSVFAQLPAQSGNWPVHSLWELQLCRLGCLNSSQEATFNLLGFQQNEAYPGKTVETNRCQRAAPLFAFLAWLAC
ncbi:unnamed protein product [Effrenium voratum]|uniref:Uncharacterized protein n=1 Tax=Effrenium voratum TaxID=2562239 RepID=A0AA36MLW9_9DINO|nr:unnamed protein product [Effrenium voratum]